MKISPEESHFITIFIINILLSSCLRQTTGSSQTQSTSFSCYKTGICCRDQSLTYFTSCLSQLTAGACRRVLEWCSQTLIAARWALPSSLDAHSSLFPETAVVSAPAVLNGPIPPAVILSSYFWVCELLISIITSGNIFNCSLKKWHFFEMC